MLNAIRVREVALERSRVAVCGQWTWHLTGAVAAACKLRIDVRLKLYRRHHRSGLDIRWR